MRKAADRGLGVAFTALGQMYERGDPFACNAVEAANLYKQSAEAGEV